MPSILPTPLDKVTLPLLLSRGEVLRGAWLAESKSLRLLISKA